MKKQFLQTPTLTELANKVRNSTVTVSLRVKESTKEFFDAEVERIMREDESDENKERGSKLTSSALMNSVLDWYVEASTRQAEKRPVAAVVKPYLNNVINNSIALMDDEALVYRAFQDGRWEVTELLHAQGYDNVNEMVRDFELIKEGNANDLISIPSYAISSVGRSMEIMCRELGSGISAKYDEDVSDDDIDRHFLNVAPGKWAVVVAVTDCFMRKLRETLDNKVTRMTPLSVHQLKLLANSINATNDRKALAQIVATALTDFAGLIYDE